MWLALLRRPGSSSRKASCQPELYPITCKKPSPPEFPIRVGETRCDSKAAYVAASAFRMSKSSHCVFSGAVNFVQTISQRGERCASNRRVERCVDAASAFEMDAGLLGHPVYFAGTFIEPGRVRGTGYR